MQVFSKEWFDKYQKTLCWLANNKLTKRWFRYILRIHSYDCPLDVNINRIEPNAFWFGGVKKGELIEIKADFRTNTKFARRLYHAFKPMWWAFHAWDWLVADRFVPAWSFGFSTLTKYPQSIGAGNPCDGAVIRINAAGETWATIIAGAGTNVVQTDPYTLTGIFVGSGSTNNFTELIRTIFCFDTSSLTSGATISAATFSFYGVSIVQNANISPAPDVNIYSSSPASTSSLANGDYSNLGSTSFSTAIAFGSFNTSGYNAFALNASGISNISKTSISTFGARNANYDVAASTPTYSSTSQNDRITGHFSTGSGASPDPKLVVTYTLPAAGGAFLYLMV